MLKKNLFYNALLSASQFLFPLITFPYTSRILKPEGIGAVNFIDSFTQYFILFSALGIPIYGIREIAKRKNNKEELSKLFSEIFLLHVISTLIFSVIYFTVAFFTPALREHMDLVFIGIALLLFSTLSVEWLYQGIEEFSYITKRSLIIRASSIVFLFVFLKPGSPPAIYYAITTGIVLLNGMSNLYRLKKHVTLKFNSIALRDHIKPLLLIFSSTLAVTAYVLLDNVLLGFLQGVIAVGIYSTAVRIVRIPYAFIYSINAVMVPQVSRAYHEGRLEQVQSCLNKSFAFICTIGFPITFGLIISAPFVVQSFAGNEFSASILTLQIIAPIIIFVGLSSILSTQLLIPIGKEKYMLFIVIIGMCFSILLNFCLIPFFSYTGAAITTICTEILVTALSFYYVKKFTSITFDKKIFFESMLAAALFIPISYLIRQLDINYLIKEISIIIVCVLFYFGYVWFYMQNVYIKNIKVILLEKVRKKVKQ